MLETAKIQHITFSCNITQMQLDWFSRDSGHTHTHTLKEKKKGGEEEEGQLEVHKDQFFDQHLSEWKESQCDLEDHMALLNEE